jgi:esterase
MLLNYKKFGEGFSVIILHGLLGSLDNWQSIAKKLAETSAAKGSPLSIYILDQRNHGKSPHSEEHSYPLLANDLFEFIQQQNIKQAHLIGHSMGGKTVMEFALNHGGMANKLVVVDIAPGEYDEVQEKIFNTLMSINLSTIHKREEVDKLLLARLNNDNTVVGFLMKGLTRDEGGVNLAWKFNLNVLWANRENLKASIAGGAPFQGPTLFIKGEKSNYINANNYADTTALFPNNQLTEIKGAGHWVHADKPNEFMAAVLEFLK